MKQHLWIGLLSVASLVGGCVTKTAPVATNDFHPVAINNFAKTWTVNLGLAKDVKPTNIYLFDNQIVVYADDNTAHVVNRQSGQLMYIHSLPIRAGAVHGPTIVGDEIIYPATSAIKMYSVKTGALLKQYSVPFAIRTSGTGSANSFYVAADHANGGRLEALDLNRTDSLPRWEVMTIATMRAAPVLYKGRIFIASQDGKVRAINEEKVSVWSLDDFYDGAFTTSGQIVADIRVDESAVYVASTDTKLVALNQANGKIKWQYFAGTALNHAPYTTNDMAYIYVDGRGLVAISKLEGDYNRKPRWIDANATMFLADDDKYTYVLLKSNQVAALDKITGEQKFVSTRNDLTQFVPNMKDGLVYATDRDGNLLQIKPVVKQGIVGELVMNDARPMEIACR